MGVRRPRRVVARRTNHIGFRLSCVGATLFLLALTSVFYGNENAVLENRALSEFECISNGTGFCSNVSCVHPDSFPFACCRAAEPSSVPQNADCRAEEGQLCALEHLCVAELIPRGSAAAECLVAWEFTSGFGLVVYASLLLYLFLAIAIVADDYFTPSLDRIGESLNVPDDVNGATFSAAGSSAPELFVSLADNVIAQVPKSIGIGTIVGSAIFNILVIIGVSALVAKLPENSPPGATKTFDWRPIARDSLFYAASIVALFFVVVDGSVEYYEGLALTGGYMLYILFMFFNERILSSCSSNVEDDVATSKATNFERTPSAIGSALSLELTESDKEDYCAVLHWPINDSPNKEGSWCYKAITDWDMLTINRAYWLIVLPINLAFRCTIPDSNYDVFREDKKNKKENRWKAFSLEFFMCIIWIALLSHFLVYFASKFGCLAGIPGEVMGLTILAAGTSVPDLLTSVIYARQGKYNFAISNSIGSNVFDILLGLGFPWFLAGLKNSRPVEVEVGELVYAVSFLFGVLIFMLALLKISSFTLNKTTGVLLSALYLVYVAIEVIKVYLPEYINTTVDLSGFV